MTSLDVLRIALRALVYAGSIGAAGGVLFALSFPSAAAAVRAEMQRQIILGCCLLLLVEPLRYAAFQLAAGGGSWSAAFGPDLRFMAFETPMGRAVVLRMIAAALLLALRRRSAAVCLGPALLMIGSFLIEGHTVGEEEHNPYATGLLLLHILAVHWWLGALYPLVALLRTAPPEVSAAGVAQFGARAVPIVLGLLAAGALLLGVLTRWQLRLETAYQQRFLVKIGLVAAILAFAAWNNRRLTPLLRRDGEGGAAQLQRSIRLETVIGLLILAATAWALNAAPDM